MNLAWRELINIAISSQMQYLEGDELEWLAEKLYDIFSEEKLDKNTKIITLILLNRNKSIGRYSLRFNRLIENVIKKSSEKLLKNLIYSVSDTNIESESEKNYFSSFLHVSRKQYWVEKIETELLALNLYIENSLYSFKPNMERCYKEVLSYQTNTVTDYVNDDTSHIVNINETCKNFVTSFLIRELDLMFILLSNGKNPYTGKLLDVKLLEQKYVHKLSVCLEEHRKDYRHRYAY